MIWRNPVAWLGLATLLIPVLIHLLVRHRAEPRPFPSLRFVQPTRLASVRRKMISDWPLLLVRIAMLAAAVAALADPLWLSAARRAEWNARQARAVVVDTTSSVAGAAGPPTGAASSTAALVERELAGPIKADVIKAQELADGIRRAVGWLRTAPPARRELVIVSDFQLGALDAAMLRGIPSHVGIRFVRTPGAPAARTVDGQARTQRAAASGGATANSAAGFAARTPRVTLNGSGTAVTWVDAASSSSVAIETSDAATTAGDITLRPFDLKLRGGAEDRPFLIAAAEAVLAQGVPIAAGGTSNGVRQSATLIIEPASTGAAAPRAQDASTLMMQWQVDTARAIATDASLTRATTRTASKASSDVPAPWIVLMRDAGGGPAILAAADGANGEGRMLVWSRLGAADEATALLIRATLRALAGADSFGEAEVIAIPDATLAQWQRPSTEPPASEWRDVGGNDRRWLWGAVLALLVAEQLIRRRARHADVNSDRKVLEHAA